MRPAMLVCSRSIKGFAWGGLAASRALAADGAPPACASPTFRSDGPNAEAYGAAEGYPLGTEPQLRFMVGSYCRFDRPFSPVPRASKRATMALDRPTCQALAKDFIADVA